MQVPPSEQSMTGESELHQSEQGNFSAAKEEQTVDLIEQIGQRKKNKVKEYVSLSGGNIEYNVLPTSQKEARVTFADSVDRAIHEPCRVNLWALMYICNHLALTKWQ